MANEHKKLRDGRAGRGGIKCWCCCEPPGSSARKRFFRAVRRVAKRIWKKEMRED